MIATNKKFEYNSGQFTESNFCQYSGHTFTNGGQNYKNVLTSFLPDFGGLKWVFTYSLYVQNNLDNTWTHVKNHSIIADNNTYRDANGNLFLDSGDNENIDNAFVYTNGGPIMDGEDIISYQRVKTLKQGLTVSEWVQFWSGVLDQICRPELEASIIAQSLYGIDSIV